MKRDRMLELRVLTGTHAGARVLLPDAPQVLGSAEDCDLILCDDGIAPQHARLERMEDGSALLHVLDRDLPPIHIRPGQGAEVGQVRIAVEEADAPWNEDVPIADQPPPDVIPATGGVAESSTEAAGHLQARVPRPPDSQAQGQRRSAAGLWMVLGASVLLAAGMMTYMAWTGAPRAPGSQAGGSLAGAPNTAALSTVAPAIVRPGLRVLSDEELQAAMVDALLWQSEAIERPLTSAYLGAGRFRVSGRVADDRQRQSVLGQLAAAVPEARGFEHALRTDLEAGDAVLEELRQQAALDIQGEWVQKLMAMRVRVNDGSETARWERALVAVMRDHDLPFKATLIGPGAQKAVEALIPPRVRSVVGGPSPYVVLADGSKVMLEGTVGNLRLVEITPRAAVFASPSGQRATVER